jgi:hypothetical protein
MGNQTQNPNQNPGQRAPGQQDDKTRRDTGRTDQDNPNRQRTPGSDTDDSGNKKEMQDK